MDVLRAQRRLTAGLKQRGRRTSHATILDVVPGFLRGSVLAVTHTPYEMLRRPEPRATTIPAVDCSIACLTHAPVQDIIRKSKTARRLEEASSVASFAVTGSRVF